MARKRKTRSADVRVGPLLLALGICLFACGSGMGYIWHRNRNAQLGREIRAATAQLEGLRSTNLLLDQQLDGLRSPRALEAAVRNLNLGLVMPQPEQILRIPEGQPGAAVVSSHMLRMAARRP
ncbi:MAG TPA: hypothetical protein PKM43_05130 [Verrucomicrobiota bacterium]|nr:hypothetical protein [Verrucomicrobiota bacterium]HRZ34951.1 hypothetical protein [Candidatus Paceibacterota bacterium]HRZ54944.1 hypothetical protein [Candidatus Paceibacterota bacterium]